MKKNLLSFMLMCVGVAGTAWADTYALVTDASTLANGDQVIVVGKSGSNYYAMKNNTSGNIGATSVTCTNNQIEDLGTDVQVFVLEASSSDATAFALKQKDGSKYAIVTSTSKTNTSYSTTAYYKAIKIASSGSAATIYGNSSRYFRFWASTPDFRGYSSTSNGTDVYIYRYVAPAANVATPEFGDVVENEDGFSVTITGEDGATLYYTTDGTTPTVPSDSDDATNTTAVYSGAISFTDPIAIKAIAVLNGETSNVGTFSNNKYFRKDFSDFIANGTDAAGVVKNTITAIYQNGTNLYVKANDTYMLVFGSLDATLSNGDTFPRLAGNFVVYNGTPEFTNPEIGEITTGGAAVEPEAVADLSTVTSDMCNSYISLQGVKISNVSGTTSATITDANGNTIALYNKFGVTLSAGENFDIVGFVNSYKSSSTEAIQLYPISIDGVVSLGDIVATPAFEDGVAEVVEGTTVTFLADNAEKIVLTDAEGQVVEGTTFNNSTLSWTPEYGTYEGYKVTATLGEESTEMEIARLDVTALTVGEINGTYINNNNTIAEGDEVVVKVGSRLTFSAENAKHIKLFYLDDDAQEVVLAEVEGDKLTWTPDAVMSATDVEVFAYRYGQDSNYSTLDFNLTVNEKSTETTFSATIDFSNSEMYSGSYGNGKTVTWISEAEDASGNTISFETICTVGTGKTTYATITGGTLRVYGSNSNVITINAPSGYVLSEISFVVDTANSSGNIPVINDTECTKVEETGDEAESAPRRATSVWETYSYTFTGSDNSSCDLSASTSTKNLQIGSATITISMLPSGIEAVATDSINSSAAVEYFNLQGQRVANPTEGLYIRRQGQQVEKVVIR